MVGEVNTDHHRVLLRVKSTLDPADQGNGDEDEGGDMGEGGEAAGHDHGAHVGAACVCGFVGGCACADRGGLVTRLQCVTVQLEVVWEHASCLHGRLIAVLVTKVGGVMQQGSCSSRWGHAVGAMQQQSDHNSEQV